MSQDVRKLPPQGGQQQAPQIAPQAPRDAVASTPPKPTREQWEYKSQRIPTRDWDDVCNALGADGWQMQTPMIDEGLDKRCYFMRRKDA